MHNIESNFSQTILPEVILIVKHCTKWLRIDQTYINVLTYILKTAFCSFQCLSILQPEARKEKRERKKKKLSTMLPCNLFILFMDWKIVQVIIYV